MIKRLQAFFTREDINTKRQANIDYAKVLAIILMILVHLFMYPEFRGNVLATIVNEHMNGYMAAPIFMIAMGIGLSFSKNDNPNKIMIRGAKLFALNYIVNVLRSLSPIIYTIATNSVTSSPEDLDIFISYFVQGDILAFAGLALILFGLLKKLKHYKIIIPCVGIIFNIIATAVGPVITTSYSLSYIVGLFYPIGRTSLTNPTLADACVSFSLMCWFITIGIGYTFGLIIRKIKNLDRFYLYCLIIGIILFVPLVTCESYFNFGIIEIGAKEIYHYSILFYDVVMIIGYMLINFSLFYFLSKLIKSNKFNHAIFKCSNAVNEIYIVSWILILDVSAFILVFVIGRPTYPLYVYLLEFVLILIASIIIGVFWKTLKEKRRLKAK